MWNYIYFMVYIQEKEPTERSGWETYVHDCIAAKHSTFSCSVRDPNTISHTAANHPRANVGNVSADHELGSHGRPDARAYRRPPGRLTPRAAASAFCRRRPGLAARQDGAPAACRATTS